MSVEKRSIIEARVWVSLEPRGVSLLFFLAWLFLFSHRPPGMRRGKIATDFNLIRRFPKVFNRAGRFQKCRIDHRPSRILKQLRITVKNFVPVKVNVGQIVANKRVTNYLKQPVLCSGELSDASFWQEDADNFSDYSFSV